MFYFMSVHIEVILDPPPPPKEKKKRKKKSIYYYIILTYPQDYEQSCTQTVFYNRFKIYGALTHKFPDNGLPL